MIYWVWDSVVGVVTSGKWIGKNTLKQQKIGHLNIKNCIAFALLME
jgi:hypothetical protein